MDQVCLDNQILIWGIQGHDSHENSDVVQAAQAFIQTLDESKAEVYIPSLVVSEFLCGIPVEEHSKVLGHFQRDYRIIPHDAIAARRSAEIFRSAKENGTYDALIDDPTYNRRQIKADCHIAGTALAHGMDCIYSHDGPLQALAGDFIDVRKMPEVGTQMELMDSEGEKEQIEPPQ